MTGQPSPKSVRLRRSVLCLPASNERAIAKLDTLEMDSVILDLEDAVAEEAKDQARANIRSYFAKPRPAGRETIVRVNGRDTAHYEDDLRLVLDCAPDAVLVPKVETHEDILELSLFLNENDAPAELRIWAMMETPLAILNAGPIAKIGGTPGGRLDCLVVGLNDLRKDTGVKPEPARTYLVPWLMQVVLAARAFGLTAIDSVSNDFRDLGPFEAECAQGRAMGFDGKMLIHPAQIEPANRHFQPSEEEVAEARRIVAAFESPEGQGANALAVDGRMVERLHYHQALALIAAHDKINGKKTP